MKKKLVIIMIVLAAASLVQAQNSKVFLKNGSEFTGYLAKQVPGKTIEIHATEAVINVDKSLIDMKDKDFKLKDLPKEWQSWANNNNAVSNDIVKLTELSYKDKEPSVVKILERGSTVKYFTCTENDYQFPWSDLDYFKNSERDKELLSAINDVIVLKNGESYKGQILENHPGKSIKIYTDKDVTEVIDPSQILSISKVANNPNRPIYEQARMMDRVIFNVSDTVNGIIVEQVMGKNVTILLKNGDKREMSSKSILEYAKIPNKDYKEYMDIHIEDGELRLEEGNATLTPVKIQKNDNEGLLYFTEDHAVSTINDKNVVIFARIENSNPVVSVIKTKTLKQGGRVFETFTYKDIATPSIKNKISDSPYDNTIKIEFKVKDKGYYVIYIKDTDKYYILKK